MDYNILLSRFERSQDVAGWPRQRVIHACLRAAIVTGQLGSGSRLLATRALADELGVARNTVLYAYEQLATEGLIRGTPRGSLVMAIAPSDMALQKSPPRNNEVARRVQRLRSLPASGPEAGAFVPGVPALDLFPAKPWRRILDQAWRDIDPSQLNYPDVAGFPALREEIRHYLMASRGMRCLARRLALIEQAATAAH